jgi:excisionase family DNA binding protein
MFAYTVQPKVQRPKVQAFDQPASISSYLRSLRRELTVKETARILARHPETVRIMISAAGLPAVKRGRTWRIDPIRLADWLVAE